MIAARIEPRVVVRAGLALPESLGEGFDPELKGDPEMDFLLAEHAGQLDLRPPGEHGRPGIQVRFPPDTSFRPGASQAFRKNPLIRAFGKRTGPLLDLTAGLGGDAYRLAFAGHTVHGFERHPAIFALLASGWSHARAQGVVPADVASRLRFSRGDGAQVIGASSGTDSGIYSGIYVDPMYPAARRASAKPRRELQVLRALLGSDVDAALLVTHARSRAARVVVKRPHHAKPLVDEPSHVIETKLVRFDVYVNPALTEEGGAA